MGVGLADVAAEYVRLHRVERQSLQIRSVNRVELTVIQNLWADRVGKARLDIRSAPEVVMRAIERSKRVTSFSVGFVRLPYWLCTN